MTSIIKVDQIQTAAGGDVMQFDGNGDVTTNNIVATSVTAEVKRTNIPYIQLLHNTNYAYSAGVPVSDWRVRQSNKISYSGGVLTIPETGLYQVGISLISSSSGGLYLYINGTKQFRLCYGSLGTGESWSALSGDCILYLNQNDTVQLNTEQAMQIYGHTGGETVSSFYCYMIG